MTTHPAAEPAEDQPWDAALAEIITGAHVASADDLVDIIDHAVARLDLSVQLYLVDLAQRQLNPVRPQAGPVLGVDATVAGRAFRLVEIIPADAAEHTLWVPLLDGTERLGVVRMVLPPRADPHDDWIRRRCWVLAGLIGHLVAGKLPYSDRFHLVRRTLPMSIAAELLWQLLPPQTFACAQLVVAAVMEPYDQVGGDGYDYAVDADRAHLAVFDAVGHDLAAGLTTTLALAATRNARRAGQDLLAAAAQADQVIAEQAGSRFATALLAELDLTTGVLRYLNAGHPPPVLIRRGRMIKTLLSPIRVPLGLGQLSPVPPRVGSEQLEPGDRVLLHTDGITEARDARGAEFGVDRLVDLAERHHGGGLPAPETLRRIAHAVLEHQRGHLQDDATLLLLEWAPTAPAGLLPTF
ncbi:MAG TPA: PP2C family protein-serine/threonine phosphatase [Actinophytocola sp.]|uniref:PP2C family protein-serine/threonine phosphatase n=1 Tax=Actinophytocola sp. TaxID=1872138 RepID=UPI002DBFBBAA|nr:PP2C family protein-serine/threonine phosphatase [Actinophytocola sp.]HEU5475912.1 PP2C family protein-serine/threonine phosphatase [Actinophytocola sp.]